MLASPTMLLVQAPISGPEAERMALTAFREVGLGDVRFLATRRYPEVGQPPITDYTVQCRAASGVYEARVSALGAKVWTIQRLFPRPRLSGYAQRAPTLIEAKAALAFARRLGVVGPLRIDKNAETYGETTEVHLCRLVNGPRLFVGNTPVGADITLDPKGHFVGFHSIYDGVAIPVVSVGSLLPPKIALDRYLAFRHGSGRSLRFVGPPERIYYTPQYRQPARPAYAVLLQYGPPDSFVAMAFVDAATGAFLHH